MRHIRLPDDLIPLAEMLGESFQYPENSAWSVQTDEKEEIVNSFRNFRRLWPLIRLIQFLSPSLRDILQGFVWEEDNQLAGVTIIQRHSSTDVWIVGTVGVLPAFRRRGIARELVAASLDLIRERKGQTAWLDVIDGNLPARALYENLGFEHYSGSIEFHCTPEKAPEEPTLPEGYIQTPLDRFDWQPRYELEKRISPENLLKYEPVEVDRFRQPAMMRLLFPIVMFAQGIREADFLVRTDLEGQVVAHGRYAIPIRASGRNTLSVRLDPEHPELAPYLVQHQLHQVMTLSPGRRIEISVPQWMEAVVTAAEEAGFERRMEYSRMGIEL